MGCRARFPSWLGPRVIARARRPPAAPETEPWPTCRAKRASRLPPRRVDLDLVQHQLAQLVRIDAKAHDLGALAAERRRPRVLRRIGSRSASDLDEMDAVFRKLENGRQIEGAKATVAAIINNGFG